jgi:hypothetical protein
VEFWAERAWDRVIVWAVASPRPARFNRVVSCILALLEGKGKRKRNS